MKKIELERRIKAMGIPPSIYSLNGATNIGGVIFEKINDDLFRVFVRGDKMDISEEREFSTEDRACGYMYDQILIRDRLLPEKIKILYRIIE